MDKERYLAEYLLCCDLWAAARRAAARADIESYQAEDDVMEAEEAMRAALTGVNP